MKVWICTAGCYSDYMIKAVSSTLEMAAAVSKAYEWNDPIEIEVDSEVPTEAMQGLLFFQVAFYYDASGKQEAVLANVTSEEDYHCTKWYDRQEDGGSNFYTYCWAKDKDDAIKIAADIKAQNPRKP